MGVDIIFRHSLSLAIHHTQIELGIEKPLFGKGPPFRY
jgi:hypothetical protein